MCVVPKDYNERKLDIKIAKCPQHFLDENQDLTECTQQNALNTQN